MGILKRYKRFDEVLAMFLPEKEMQVTRTAYLGYTRAAFLFEQWLKEQGLSNKPMRRISVQNIADYSMHIAGLKYDKPTCESFIMQIRTVFKYALKRKEITILPFDRDLIVFPKKGKDCSAALIPSYIVPVLLDDIKRHDPQLFLACMLEFYCGIRPGREVRLIQVHNFDLKEGILTIDAEKSKNGKTGRITMSNDLIQICKDYGIEEGVYPDLYVFGKNKHLDVTPLSENMLRYRFNKYRDKYGLSKDVKLYSFKHMGASYLVHSKVIDILELKEHLRHANLGATQHYVKKVIGEKNTAIKTQFPNPLKEVI